MRSRGTASLDGFHACCPTPFAVIGIRASEGRIEEIRYLPLNTALLAPANATAAAAWRQIERYLDDPEFRFDLPLAPAGSAFQRAVWREISRIGSGRTRTYGELAQRLGSGARAVGAACGDNPLPLVVPCHRVIGARGLGGFMHSEGAPELAIKRWLLAHEGALRSAA